MPNQQDLLQAKQLLSASLLRAGARAGVVGTRASIRVENAIAAAGHNVHAVGIGRKTVNGQPTNTLAVRVYVVQKLADSLLPPIRRIPEFIDGIPTDVIQSSPAFILRDKRARRSARRAVAPKAAAAPACSVNRFSRQRPVVAGISTGHFQITAGTLGYFCRSTKHGDNPSQVFVLSNNHVYADVNRAALGDDLYQPGPADGGTPPDTIADLHRFVEIRLGGLEPNRVDAAIGKLRPGVAHVLEICTIGPVVSTVRATEGMPVRKHGRTTGYTEGKVTDESYDALVGMDHADDSVVALFENQMRIETIAPFPAIGKGGDSGSLVIGPERAAVGLYFAGPPSGSYGIANHIDAVLNELEIELL